VVAFSILFAPGATREKEASAPLVGGEMAAGANCSAQFGVQRLGGAFLSGWSPDDPAYGTTIRDKGTESTKCGQADLIR
jgi:hypothetical protein